MCDEETWKKITELAKKNGMSVSAWLRWSASHVQIFRLKEK